MPSIKKLIKKLQQHEEALSNKQMGAEGLSDLINDTNNLLEKLYVLRYKVYESSVKKVEEPTPKKEAESIPSFQLNLQTEPVAKAPEPKQEVKAEEQPLAKETAQEKELRIQKTVLPEPEEKQVEKEDSLNDRLARIQEDRPTFAEKMQKKPISDLKKAIGLNERFSFINELFQQNADIFHNSIDQLNNCESFGKAIDIVQNDFAVKYEWDMESRSVTNLMELVERRYA